MEILASILHFNMFIDRKEARIGGKVTSLAPTSRFSSTTKKHQSKAKARSQQGQNRPQPQKGVKADPLRTQNAFSSI